jgi:hypothetical protein
VGSDLRECLQGWPPAFYLDFEAILPAVPLYPGTRPYQTSPFQWSLHHARSGPHQEFLGDAHSDPRRALTDWPRNRLLLALPSRNLKRLTPEFEHIRCEREQVLMDADSSLDYVFFPERGVVSVVAVYADGSVIEMATIGREGCTGMQAFFGAKTSSVRLLAFMDDVAQTLDKCDVHL